jgi:AraC-like DNA-binding protein
MGAREDLKATERPLSFRTADIDTAREQVTKTFAAHEMAVADGRNLAFHLELAPSPRLTLGSLSYGADVTITGPPMRSNYHVNLPISGVSTVTQNGQCRTSVAGQSGIALLPSAPLSIRWSPDGVQYAIKLPKELLEAHATKLAGRPAGDGIRFALDFDLTSGAGQALVATTGFLYAELSRPGGIATIPAARYELESLLMTQLLMTIPSQLTPELHGRPTHTRRSKIREIMDYVDENPEAEISTADLAARAGVSARALQLGFRDVVGMSPSAYVRGVRLDRVRFELETGVSRSVTDVAARWGFFHPGRFARQYRERFGMLPSETAGIRPAG